MARTRRKGDYVLLCGFHDKEPTSAGVLQFSRSAKGWKHLHSRRMDSRQRQEAAIGPW